MVPSASTKKSTVKIVLTAASALLIIGAAVAWYFFTKGFDDTATVKADYTVTAMGLIAEFKSNEAAANKKYAEKIVAVSGRVTAVESADTTLNLKMAGEDGSYILFAFQQNGQAAVKQVKEGDSVSIKGSCNGGTYSEILEAESITFKRCTLNK